MSDPVLPTIDRQLCIGCGKCVEECPTAAVEMRGGYPEIVRPDDCAYCGACEEICPVEAIYLVYEIITPTSKSPRSQA
ncbi:MAG: 4Fe-4S binding protein [Anaerolineae bacterium]|nr:4Fe-4S binding protein [Anaerolineae bacterium]